MTPAGPQTRTPRASDALVELPNGFEWKQSGELPWIEACLSGARAAFSTRLGGVSDGPYASLNLGFLTDDERARVARNRELLGTAVGRDPGSFAFGLQVHGPDLTVHDRRPSRTVQRADAQLTTSDDVTPAVVVADCLPVILSGGGAVAAVHCGWRGIAAGIVERGVKAVAELGGSRAGSMAAAIGPGIAPCCYRVGDEVRSAFSARGHAQQIAGPMLDLAGAVRVELERAGLARTAIQDCGLCTSCNEALFFSHRRDAGLTGRQAGMAWLA